MAEDNTAEAVEAEAPEATEEQAEEKVETKPEPTEDMVPKSDVERIVKDRLARERRKWSREQKQMAEAESKNNQEPTADAGEVESLRAEVAQMRAEREADKIEAGFLSEMSGVDVSETDRKMLRVVYEHDREAFFAKVKEVRAAHMPPERKGAGVNTPAAPNGAMPGAVSEIPSEWSADVVAAKRAAGTFLSDIAKYRASLPGGGGGLFPAKVPGKK